VLALLDTPERNQVEVTRSGWSGELILKLDGKELVRVRGDWTSFSENCTLWLAVREPDCGRLLIKCRVSGWDSGIRDLRVWVDPPAEKLRELGEERLIGCEYFSACERLGRPGSWKNFKEDFKAFVGHGFRFSLSHLLVFVMVYGTGMGLTIALDPPHSSNEIVLYALGWLFGLGLFLGAGLGFSVRHPDATAEEKRWYLFKRTLGGTIAGFLAAMLFTL